MLSGGSALERYATSRASSALRALAKRMPTRSIALQTAVGEIVLSAVGMIFAAFGYLPSFVGAITQEVIDLAAVLNALRTTVPGGFPWRSVFKNGNRVISDRFAEPFISFVQLRIWDLLFAMTPVTKRNYYFAYFAPDAR
jgi:hypothetical protein